VEEGELSGRKAPYAPISALREFFSRMRDVSVPQRVDRRFIQKQNVASNNEWALLSALKFLGVVDERGAPTHAYRLLQSTDQFEATLRHLVETAYAQLFDSGATRMSTEDLENYFRVTSSPSQAKNAARFFREVCALAGIDLNTEAHRGMAQPAPTPPQLLGRTEPVGPISGDSSLNSSDLLLAARAHLLEKLPACREEWSAVEYEAICRHFSDMLKSLEPRAAD
jgi:hypothetical protein